jgi:hypothetical protein
MIRHAHATPDPQLQARIQNCIPLRYRDGADASIDRPAHVRAGSSLARVGEELVVVQDDALFLALIEPSSGLARGVPLPAGKGGVRLFDDGRGNKNRKLDLEACVAVPDLDSPHGAEMLLAFGSGSKAPRERVVMARLGSAGESARETVRVFEAPDLYALLRGAADFAGSDMNIEGAVFMDGTVRLFNRGNGKARRGLLPVDATIDFAWPDLHAHLHGGPVPEVGNITQHDLGTLDGQRLSFTDAALWRVDSHGVDSHGVDSHGSEAILFSSAAELSDDATTDGTVAGSALGVMKVDGSGARWAPLLGADGAAFPGKIEGVMPATGDESTVWVVVDTDDYSRPSELCEVLLSGHWRGG